MRQTAVRVLILLVIFGLAVGFFTDELVSSASHKNCPVCAAKKCQDNAQCHDSAGTKPCICSHRTSEVSLPRSSDLPDLTLIGNVTQNLHFNYSFLRVDDIFHPPKA